MNSEERYVLEEEMKNTRRTYDMDYSSLARFVVARKLSLSKETNGDHRRRNRKGKI